MAYQVKDLLSGALSRNGIYIPLKASDVVRQANNAIIELFGRGFDRRARAAQFKGGEVIIEVNSAVIETEMRFQEKELLQKIQQYEPTVESIVFRMTLF